MSAVLPAAEFSAWLDEFMPAPDSPAFEQFAQPIVLGADAEDLDTGQLGAKSHLIGLAFTRAEGLERMAAVLPADDPRVAAYRAVADDQAARGLDAMFEADYLGSHWLATFALKYYLARAPRN